MDIVNSVNGLILSLMNNNVGLEETLLGDS